MLVSVTGGTGFLGAARRAGADPIIHVSGVVALLPAREHVVRVDSPVGTAPEEHFASKAAAKSITRHHQATSAPVLVTYPSAPAGPHDPYLGNQNARVRDTLRGLLPLWPTGGFPFGDVRDTTLLPARLLETGGPGRVFEPGAYVSTRDYSATLRDVTGRALPAVHLSARAMLPVRRLAGLVRRIWPWHLPVEHGAVHTCGCATRVAAGQRTGGLAARPVADTVRDTVRWLHDSGLLSARRAGRLGSPAVGTAP